MIFRWHSNFQMMNCEKKIVLYSGIYNVYVIIQTIYHIREIASRFYGQNHSFHQDPCSTQPVQPWLSGTTWCSLQITTHVMDIQAQQMTQAMGLEDCTHPSLHTPIWNIQNAGSVCTQLTDYYTSATEKLQLCKTNDTTQNSWSPLSYCQIQFLKSLCYWYLIYIVYIFNATVYNDHFKN